MSDYSKLTVSDIKDRLQSEGYYNKEELDSMDVKGKKAWAELYSQCQNKDGENDGEYEWGNIGDELDNIMKDVTPLQVKPEQDQPKDPNMPKYNDPEWNDYVMSLFEEDELIDGKYPNVNSLRRIAQLLLGDIVYSGPIRVEQTMDPDDVGKAVVTYQIIIEWKLDCYYGTRDIDINVDYPQRVFTSVASSWSGNTDDAYSGFPESIAETRAEGRALRRALRINVVCADELTKKDIAAYVQQRRDAKMQQYSTTGEWDEEAPITDQQINTIQIMCDRLGIDVNKFINSGSKSYDDINKVTRTAAAGMLKQLNRYQSSGSDSVEIPQNLIGD